MTSGTLFNIQRFSVHDGPGIRTNLFFKGCPLRCLWCHNPEGYHPQPQISYQAAKCRGCASCAQACPQGVHNLENGGHALQWKACAGCGTCVAVCPGGALSLFGKRYTALEAAEAALRDEPFYRGGGGVTLSGGEPMAQADFAIEVARLVRERGVSVCVETSGYCDADALRTIAPMVEQFLYDIKETDAARHREYTGVDMDRIHQNLFMLDAMGAHTVLRCPVIPGLNAREAHFDEIARIANSLKHVQGIDLEPYHPLGLSKREQIGMKVDFDLKEGMLRDALEPYMHRMQTLTKVPVRIS